jgi:glutamate-ammonia-ligase adenylyltransferase
LLRAAPLAGDARLTEAFLAGVADRIRYPTAFGTDQVREVRRLKARMEAERVSPARRARDVKLGPGGLSDVEWTIQLLQLRHAHAVPALRVTGTLPALRAATEAGLLPGVDAEALQRAWVLASRVRNAVTLVSGGSSDLVPPTATRELAGVARLLGYPPDASVSLLEDLRRQARRARAVTDRLFYGESS